MSNVLIVTNSFVPYSASFGGCARCVYLTKFLSGQGFRVTVLASGGEFNSYFGHDNISDMAQVEYVGKVGVEGTSGRSSFVSRRGMLNRIVRRLESRFIVPDRHVFKIPRFWKALKQVMLRDRPSTVIVSVPPHGLAPLADLVKRNFPDVKVILDYRDSWNTTPIFSKGSKISSWASVLLEKRILKVVDHLVHVSPVVPQLLLEKLGVNVLDKSLLVMNGFPEAYFPGDVFQPSPQGTAPVVGYFGSVNDRPEGYRDISFVFDLLDKGGVNAKFYFWGELELTHRSLTDYAEDVKYMGQLDHKSAIEAAAKCDALLIVHTDPNSAKEVIPGKFFDYLAAGRPIICVAPPFSQVAKMVVELGVGVVVDPTDLLNLSNFFAKAIKDVSTFENTKGAVPALNYTREAQFMKLLEII